MTLKDADYTEINRVIKELIDVCTFKQLDLDDLLILISNIYSLILERNL